MSKELDALERLRNTLLAEGYWQDVLQDTLTIEKSLKALEIIKEKRVNACEIINSKDVREYDWSIHTPKKYHLTQAEFDLLKEVLLWART